MPKQPASATLRAARAEEDRAMRSELHLARRAASLAQQRLAAATSEAALRDHSAKALVAKQSCELETLRSERSWDEVTHRRSGSQLSAVSSHASSMEALSRVAVASLGSEIALLEARRQETTSQLADLLDAYKVQGEHLGMLHEQATRAHALLAQQQEQLVDMQKQLTAQQRRATRLQGEVHAARLIQTERGRMQEALEHAEMVRARAEQQAASHDAVERTLRAEAAQEREASIEALARQEAGHEAEMSAVRGRLDELETLFSRLLADTARVMLRNGGGATMADYVRTQQRRYERERLERPAGERV